MCAILTILMSLWIPRANQVEYQWRMRPEGFTAIPIAMFVMIGEHYIFINITSMVCFTVLFLERS